MQDLLDSQTGPTKTIHDHNGQDGRKAIQERTFTRWMNVFLQRRVPPLKVCDLFTDIQDGRMLMALLEELSGCRLLYRFRSSSHRIFRLNNISKALAFLDDRHVKLLGIDASAIADGNPSVVLSLVWNIILHFQVKEATGGLQRHLSSSLSSISLSAYPSSSDLSPQTSESDSYSSNTLPRKGKKARRDQKYHSKTIKSLLHWVQRCTSKYGVDVDDFGASWRSGLAFLALIKSINPDLVDLRENLSKEPRENIQQAFMVAHQFLDIPPLLEPEDCTSPDEQSIITYVSMFLGRHSVVDEGQENWSELMGAEYRSLLEENLLDAAKDLRQKLTFQQNNNPKRPPDQLTHFDFPEIPSFGSLEAVSFRGTPADDPEAKALLTTFEKSNEQRLWRQWSRRFSETSKALDCRSNKNGSPETSFPSSQRVLEPPSPLEASVTNQEIRSWMDKGYGKKRVHGSHVSQSSEEGIYSLSVLDSDEEDAYSYILDLNKDVFQPNNPPTRQVPKVEEETAEEMEEESKHLEALGMFNGGRRKQQGGPLNEDTDFNPESAIGVQSAAHRKFDLDKSKSSLRETTNNRAVFVLEPEAERGSRGDPRFKRGTNSDACTEEESKEKMENNREGKDGFDNTLDCGVKARVFGVANWKYVEEEGEELSEKLGHVSERTAGEDLGRLEEGRDLKEQNETEEAGAKKKETSTQICVNSQSFSNKTEERMFPDEAGFITLNRNGVTVNNTGCKAGVKAEEACHLMTSSDYGPVQTQDWKKCKPMVRRHKDLIANHKTTPKRPPEDTHDGDNGRTAACRPSSHLPRNGGGFAAQPMAASCSITPLELEMLLLLWILLYCYLILSPTYL